MAVAAAVFPREAPQIVVALVVAQVWVVVLWSVGRHPAGTFRLIDPVCNLMRSLRYKIGRKLFSLGSKLPIRIIGSNMASNSSRIVSLSKMPTEKTGSNMAKNSNRIVKIMFPISAMIIMVLMVMGLELWLAQAQRPTGGRILGYKTTRDGITIGLLKTPGLDPWDPFTCLTSLREVEPTVNLILDDRGLDTEVW